MSNAVSSFVSWLGDGWIIPFIVLAIVAFKYRHTPIKWILHDMKVLLSIVFWCALMLVCFFGFFVGIALIKPWVWKITFVVCDVTFVIWFTHFLRTYLMNCKEALADEDMAEIMSGHEQEWWRQYTNLQ